MNSARRPSALAIGAAVAAALPVALWLREFMVDDALISARYAAHLWSGLGYRFNPGGPLTDGVTPFGWAAVLAPFAGDGAWAAYRAAKGIGLLAWLAGAGVLGLAIARLGGSLWRYAALLLVACSASLGAWSVAGMETGLVLGLAAAAVSARVLGRERWLAGLAGVVAAWRPECLPWAVILALGPPREGEAQRWRQLALAAGPAVAVALIRLALFGRATPLSAIAKPADLPHGLVYALATFLLCGPIAALAWSSLPRWVRGLQAALVAHWLAIAAAGGDWMPLSRLAVAAQPTVILVAAAVLARERSRPWRAVDALRLGAALAGMLYALITVGPKAAGVESKRKAVIDQLREPLADAEVIAALDVGWVGAAAPNATVVDFAGVTDLDVAVLPGGHTTKRIPRTLIERRGVDHLVLLLADGEALAEPWTRTRWSRWVEHHVAGMSSMVERFTPVAVSEGRHRYVVLRRREGGS